MKYDVISADGHVDLIWLPPDLFTKNASAALKDRMPHVVEGAKGPEWVSAKGAKFGLVNGDIMHGHMSLDQLWAARPVMGHASHRAPIKGLYMCGAGCHPGGGVSGNPGRNAAREILRDLKRR